LRLSIHKLNKWQSQFEGKINFLLVYIAEAHAKDVWPLGNRESLPSHETLQDRLNAAQILLKKYNCEIPMLLDTMSDGFDKAFAIWPERYYVIAGGKVEHVFMPDHEFGFDQDNMYELLRQLSKKPLPPPPPPLPVELEAQPSST